MHKWHLHETSYRLINDENDSNIVDGRLVSLFPSKFLCVDIR